MKIQNRSKTCLIISCAIMVIALVLTIFGHGINLGIDFEGGLSMEYSLKQTAVKGDLEGILSDMGIGSFTVTYQGSGESEAVIRIKDVAEEDIQNVQAGFEEKLKEKYPDCAVTLSLGEKSYEEYKAYREAGADRYLLRHETANEEHYGKLHPENMSWKNRIRCLEDLKKLGYQTGCGVMIGSPGQTSECLADDMLLMEKLTEL